MKRSIVLLILVGLLAALLLASCGKKPAGEDDATVTAGPVVTETPTTAPQTDGETTTRRPIIIETPTTTEEPTKEPVAPSTAQEVDPGEPGWSPNV